MARKQLAPVLSSARLVAAEASLRRCILGGITLLTGVVTALVALCVYVPGLCAATATSAFGYAALASFVVSLLLELSTSFVRGHAYQRFVFVVFGLASVAAMVAMAHTLSSRAVVVVALSAAAILTGVAAAAGSRLGDLSAMWPLLAAGAVVVLVACLLNTLVFRARWLETAVSTVCVVLFTAYSVYDANAFVKRRACRHSCCEEGVFSLYENFVGGALNLMNLAQDS